MNFRTKFTQKRYYCQKRKKGTSPLNFAVRISLGTKVHLKLTILTFWTKFAQKGYFTVQNKKTKLLRASKFNLHDWTLAYGSRQTKRYFNASSSVSRRDNNWRKQLKWICSLRVIVFVVFWPNLQIFHTRFLLQMLFLSR